MAVPQDGHPRVSGQAHLVVREQSSGRTTKYDLCFGEATARTAPHMCTGGTEKGTREVAQRLIGAALILRKLRPQVGDVQPNFLSTEKMSVKLRNPVFASSRLVKCQARI